MDWEHVHCAWCGRPFRLNGPIISDKTAIRVRMCGDCFSAGVTKEQVEALMNIMPDGVRS